MPGPQGPFIGQQVLNALIPKEGPKAIPLTFDFTVGNSFTVDFTLAQQSGQISLIQTLFVDNSENADALTILSPAVNLNLKIPPFTQGYYPVMSPNPPKFTVSTAGGVAVNIWFVNVPIPFASWSPNGTFSFAANGDLLVSDPALEALISGGALLTRSQALNISDASATIAVGGTSQVLLAANAARTGFIISNLQASGGDVLTLNPNGAATIPAAPGSLIVPAATTLIFNDGAQGSNAWQINGLTTGDKFTCKAF